MIPAPNFIAGVLIGLINDPWTSVALSSIGWSFVFCVYVTLTQNDRKKVTIASFAEKGQRLFLGSPTITFYAIEFITALATSIVVGSIVYGLKNSLYKTF